jgi:thiol peroxidase
MPSTAQVTFRGSPLTLSGPVPDVGDQAPDFTAQKTLLEPVTLSQFRGRRVLLTAAPSVDTGVCAAQLRRFNEAAASLGDDVALLYVTKDLPFALSRFCAAEGIQQVITASDYKSSDVANRYGLLMTELGLLARSVFVIDRAGVITYREVVPEMTHAPDYDAALAALAALP